MTGPVTITQDDADDLVETLDLLRRWFDSDRPHLTTSLNRHMAWAAVSLGSLRDDLGRFIDTLGGLQR